MFKHIFSIAVAITVMSITSVANAVITDVYWTPLDGDPTVAGSVQNTLFTSMTNDWTNAVIDIDLTSGSLIDPVSAGLGHQLRAGGNPNDSWLDAPNDPFSISVTTNVYDFNAGDFDWFDTGNNPGISDGIAARIFATDDANGVFEVQMFDRDSAGVPTIATGFVRNGEFLPVPEPGSILLVGLGSAAALTLGRRKKRC